MGYYRGDHYRGDYYRGDPGFFSFIGKALKGAVGLIPGIGPVISTAMTVRSALKGGGVPLPAPYIPGPLGMVPGAGTALERLGSSLAPNIGVMAPGGGGGLITRSPMGTPVSPAGLMMEMVRMRHTHPNKSTYVTRGGGTSRWPQQLIVHPKHTEAVTSRRMNVGNARALRRSLRRLKGFAKLARRVMATTHHFKGGGKKRPAKK